MDKIYNIRNLKELEELIKSGNVKFFDANNITPSKDLDSYDYNLFLEFASQKELEEDSFTPETFKKIEEYKIEGLKPTVRFVEEDEEFYIDDKIRRTLNSYGP